MPDIDWKDIQGLIRRGYKEMPKSAFLLLQVRDVGETRTWLSKIAEDISTGQTVGRRTGTKGSEYFVNLAISSSGLNELAIGDKNMHRFPLEFQEGMSPKPTDDNSQSRRIGMLGDTGENDPQNWKWGGNRSAELQPHLLLMIYAQNCSKLETAIKKLVKLPTGNGVALVTDILYGYMAKDFKEHFGFLDGLSQPIIRDSEISDKISDTGRRLNVVKPGEFILGYKNERGLYPVSPELDLQEGKFDFGKNGTYLVFRHLAQHVEKFEKYLTDHKAAAPVKDASAREWVAAKMVGRWKNGAPLVLYPDSSPDLPQGNTGGDNLKVAYNDFYFQTEDEEGLKCPIGAHIRRANPRDSLESNPRSALRLSKRHRILRRGRNYGPTYEPKGDKSKNEEDRGLFFICLNADISGQFELIQNTWVNNPQFAGLFDERDPLIGERTPNKNEFATIQDRPVNKKIDDLQSFVTVRGGEYFFMPGKAALQFLASCGSLEN